MREAVKIIKKIGGNQLEGIWNLIRFVYNHFYDESTPSENFWENYNFFSFLLETLPNSKKVDILSTFNVFIVLGI